MKKNPLKGRGRPPAQLERKNENRTEASSQPEQKPHPPKPKPQYSPWEPGEWIEECLEESDLCRLLGVQLRRTMGRGPWSDWFSEPVEANETREVEIDIMEWPVLEWRADVPPEDRYKNNIWKNITIKKDENGDEMFTNIPLYRYRTLSAPETLLLYQYETRRITNQSELDRWEEQHGGE